ncbi:MAG: hypothetical protein HKO65_15480 [Gemmatimonadetes bacterium]|nr:hypothetical protein [Gemmatimonadota bacterium]NNM06494.1 hypothetical protein [Gemmatimonadota bacterium]
MANLRLEQMALRVRRSLLVASALTGIGGGLHPLAAQGEAPAAPSPQLLSVFLDCHLIISCDTDHFRREITFVNWVRQREDARLHLILTWTRSGAGTEYQFDNIGLGDWAGEESHLTWTSSSVNTRDEIINGITRTMALGFVQYAQRLGLAEQLRVVFDPADAIQTARQVQNVRNPEDDPWDFWVFRINARADLNGQDKRKVRNLNGTFSANRVTETFKVELGFNGSLNETENQLSSGDWFTSDRKSWGATGVAVKSLTGHWSLGAQFGANSSSVANRRAGFRAAPALEWNLFPYSESTRQQLIFMYQVGASWVDWWEETIFEEDAEWVFDHRLRTDLNFRQPWGSGGTAFQIASLLDDFSKWEMSLEGTVNIRLFRGFSFNLGGNYRVIRNQIGLRRRNLTDEEILTARRQLATDSSYRLNFGITFDFGSVFNNVVNTRFPQDVRGPLFFF